MDNELSEILNDEINRISKKYKLSIESNNIEIKSLKRTKKLNIPYYYNIEHFCKVTKFSQKEISFFINQSKKAYTTFEIPKKSKGTRNIDAPIKNLKLVQRWILDNVLYQLNPGEYAYGFIPNKSIIENASIHINQELICGIDIKDYFPSITANRVYGYFKSVGYNNAMAKNFTKLTTYNGRLPQGAPTSPMIANLISWRMDKRLGKYCEIRGFKYSRYADDITISGKHNLPKYIKPISRIIKSEGFEINPDKLRIIGRGSAQKVTGIIVNDSASIGRNRKRILRAIIHNISKNGPIVENRKKDPFFKERLYGNLGFTKMINPDFAKPLIKKLKNVNWKDYIKNITSYVEEEKSKRYFKKSTKKKIVNFDDLDFFKNIPDITDLSDNEIDKLVEELKQLSENCSQHGIDACQECLFKSKNSEYQKCMKYILGQYIKDTGGHHHGHEIFDIAGETKLFNKVVFVIFLLKSYGMTTAKKNSLFMQFYECAELSEPDIISIVMPDTLHHQLSTYIRGVIKRAPKEKDLCLILQTEMLRIYNDFKTQISG